jgi:hypothetical protein
MPRRRPKLPVSTTSPDFSDMATWVNGYSCSRETYFIELSRPCIVHSSFGILLFDLV